jgi:signal transduction histidine kinase
VGLLLVGVWGMAAHLTSILHRDIEHLLIGQMSTAVDDTLTDLDRDIRLQLDVLGRVSGAIDPGLLSDAQGVERLLEQREAMRAFFPEGILVADRHGLIVASYPAAVRTSHASIAEQGYFRQVMASGQPVIGPAVVGGRLQPVPLAVALRDAAGAPAGALVGLARPSEPLMLGQFEKARIGRTGYFLVVARKDRVIISASRRERIGTKLPPAGVIADLDRRLDSDMEDPAIVVTAAGVEVLGMSRNIAMTDWVFLAAVPTAEIFAPIATLKRQVNLSALLISLAIVAALGLALRKEFGRLERAAEAMRRMTEGEEPLAPLTITRDDEIGKLKGNFNRLAAERNRLDEALRSEIEAHKQARAALNDALRRLQALTEHMTHAQEEERRKIAFELHEASGQELSALKMHLQMLEAGSAGKNAKALEDARTIAAIALERLRNLSLDLHPGELDQLGLYAALRAHCKQAAAEAGWLMHFSAPEGGERPPPELELACFRVAQAVLADVAQHASATEVWVSLQRSAHELRLIMYDNGASLDAAVSNLHTDLALVGMEERVRQAGGRVEVHASSSGHGPEIHAVFPLQGS